jgi:hypothetical protein
MFLETYGKQTRLAKLVAREENQFTTNEYLSYASSTFYVQKWLPIRNSSFDFVAASVSTQS